MTASEELHLPQHVAIIMDGNNRFAKKNQMQKGDGHREGKNSLDPIVEHCRNKGIQALTVFAFSSENWNRPQYEVDLLMKLLE
ncbi:undecaprenyl diphosphate synthase family protein, partial [Acinetobacter gyllenbergii]